MSSRTCLSVNFSKLLFEKLRGQNTILIRNFGEIMWTGSTDSTYGR
jgi:hypothetical protein